jgi:jumonji domain-containing protein 7
VLYLPALWYLKVSQTAGEEGYCLSVNYWYDMEYSGGFYSMVGFVRDVGLVWRREEEERKKRQGKEITEQRPSS